MIVVVTMVPFLVHAGLLPGVANQLPELIGALALIAFIALGVKQRFQQVRPAYWILFGAIVGNMVCGVLVNGVDAGPVFAGIRTYFRAIPLFLLPAAYFFSEDQIQRQLDLVLKIALVQAPIAAYQRVQPYVTGDSVFGTLMISSFLSIFLICAGCVVTAFYLRGRLKVVPYLALLILLLAPTTFNETKGSLILVPLALLVTFLVASPRGTRIARLTAAGALTALFLTIFVPIYDYSQRDTQVERWQSARTIRGFVVEGGIERYLIGGARSVGASEQRDVRRVDAVVIPVQYLARDPVKLAFGLGIGNASPSSLGKSFTGHYFAQFELFLLHSAARLILETGLLGLILVFLLLWLIAADARRVAARDSGVVGTVAVGWVGCVVLLGCAVFWKDVIGSPPLSYLFWYFSGVVVARRMWLARPGMGSAVQP